MVCPFSPRQHANWRHGSLSKQTEKYSRGRSLDLVYVFLRYFFETEYLHFGYWKSDMALKFANLKEAQHNYIEELFKLIPGDVKTILDVGCGSGEMSKQLVEMGYEVEALCPPSIMSENAGRKLEGKATLHECKFEELEIDKQYDLIIFSESIQFIQVKDAFEQCKRYGKKYILIADLFKHDMPEKGPIGGGKPYAELQKQRDDFGFREIENVDVTEYVARHFDLEQDAIQNFIKPMVSVFKRVIAIKNSMLVKIGLFGYRKNLQKMKTRYLDSTDRNSSSFKKYKTYRFILLQIPQS